MKIEMKTKYDIGQVVYAVEETFTREFHVVGVRIDAIKTRNGIHRGMPYREVTYLTSPTGYTMDECELYATQEEAQAEASLRAELVRKGEWR